MTIRDIVTSAALAVEAADTSIIVLPLILGVEVVIFNVSAEWSGQYDLADKALRDVNALTVVRRYETQRGYDYVCTVR
jgi:hypothetical protein